MINPVDFLKALFDTFDQSAIVDFRSFLAENPEVTKWQIAADFCLHDKDRPNEVFAFSLIPYDDYLDALKSEIKSALPKDLKQTRNIVDNAKVFLSYSRRFHFGFVFKGSPNVFSNGPGTNPLVVARESLEQSVAYMIKMGRSEENLRHIKMLLQAAQAKSFNVTLLADLYTLCYLFCFVTLLLVRERKSEIVGWFSDRDKMTTWCDGVLWDLGNENLRGLAEHFAITLPEKAPVIAIPAPDCDKDAMWFDEYVRLPDYVAGILAAWDFESNLLPGDKDKYRQLAEGFVAEAKNMAVIKVRYDDIVECSRIVFSRS